MAKRAKPAAKRSDGRSKFPKVGAGELLTLLDFLRYAVSRFTEAELVFAHGTTDPVAEAAFLVCEALHLHPDQFESFATARVTAAEGKKILGLIERRVTTRKPAAYLVNKIYMRGLPFYVDERTIVPRSFIGELLEQHFGEENDEYDEDDGSLICDPASIRQRARPLYRLRLPCHSGEPEFSECRNRRGGYRKDALEVAARNVRDYALEDRLTLYRGDLFKPLGGKRYDLIISNPPYVDAEGMASLPRECRAEPKLAFDGGADGIDIVRRILDEATAHLTPQGGLLCEIGRCRPQLEAAYPQLPLLWLDTADSEGEVFWIAAADL